MILGLMKLCHSDLIKYCEQTLSEEQHSFKCIYSMMPIIQVNFLFYKTEASRNRAGSEQKREREKGANQGSEDIRESETAWVEK